MDKLKAKKAKLQRRQRRVRGKVAGTPERPRLRVTRSNTNIYAQVIAQRALNAGIGEVVFDRGGNLYHGRVKALAEGAREAGLKF